MDLTQIFGSTHAVAWWQECTRTVVVFCYGLAVVRLAGRRVFGKWSALDFIVSIIVGSSLSRAITGSAALGGTLASTTLIMLLHVSARFDQPTRPRGSAAAVRRRAY